MTLSRRFLLVFVFTTTATVGAYMDSDVMNSALNKPSIQSSTFRDDPRLFGANLANDDSPLTCAKTEWSWTLFWRVDLKELLPVVAANVTLRWEYFGSNRNKFLYRIELQVGEENVPFTETCGSQTLLLDRPDAYHVTIICNNTTIGRFATLNVTPHYAGSVSTGSPQLMLCDVEVFTRHPPSYKTVSSNPSAANDASDRDEHNHVAAASQTSEVTVADGAAGNSESPRVGLQFLSEITAVAEEKTIATHRRPTGTATRKKTFRESVTKMRLERLLKQMQLTSSSTTTTTAAPEIPVDEGDLDQEPPADDSGPSPGAEGSFSTDLINIREEIMGKMNAMTGYVVFSGIAVGMLLLLALVLGFVILWSLTCKKNLKKKAQTSEAASGHEFSFKAPSPSPPPPLPAVPTNTMDQPSHFHRVHKFPKDSVPKSRIIF